MLFFISPLEVESMRGPEERSWKGAPWQACSGMTLEVTQQRVTPSDRAFTEKLAWPLPLAQAAIQESPRLGSGPTGAR